MHQFAVVFILLKSDEHTKKNHWFASINEFGLRFIWISFVPYSIIVTDMFATAVRRELV